jgi:flagellar basal body rod protein FlgG
MAGINENLKAADSYYLDGVTVPQNTTTLGAAVRTEVAAIQGAQAVKVDVDTDIVITDTKIVTISVEHGDTESGSFSTLATIYTVTASGETTIDAGEEIANFVLPDNTKAWTRLNITTDDTGVVGAVTGFIHYLPR